MIQAASDAGNTAGLAFFIFDLLHLDGEDVGARPLIERKERFDTGSGRRCHGVRAGK
jgi:ATP-dependent DNA ligase